MDFFRFFCREASHDGRYTLPWDEQFCGLPTHRIHGTGISTYIWLKFMVNVGKYNLPVTWILWVTVIDRPDKNQPTNYFTYIVIYRPNQNQPFMDVTWILWVRMSFCCFNSPNNPGTLQWKGLNLYSRGPGLKIATFEGSGFLGCPLGFQVVMFHSDAPL